MGHLRDGHTFEELAEECAPRYVVTTKSNLPGQSDRSSRHEDAGHVCNLSGNIVVLELLAQTRLQFVAFTKLGLQLLLLSSTCSSDCYYFLFFIFLVLFFYEYCPCPWSAYSLSSFYGFWQYCSFLGHLQEQLYPIGA